MRRRKWWIVGGLSTASTLLANHKSTFVEAVIYDAVARTIEFIFRGGWMYLAAVFLVGGAIWFWRYMQSRETLMLLASANPRIAAALETRRRSQVPWGTYIGGGVGVAILLIVAYWCWERARFPFLVRQLSEYQQDAIVTAYIPERWDRSDPIVDAVFWEHMRRFNESMAKQTKDATLKELTELETLELIRPNRKNSHLKAFLTNWSNRRMIGLPVRRLIRPPMSGVVMLGHHPFPTVPIKQ